MSDINVENIRKNNASLDDMLVSFSYNMALVRLGDMLKESKSHCWIKKDYNYLSHSDFCFFYKGNVYSVLVDIRDSDGNSFLTPEQIKRQIDASEKYNFIACKFPMVLKSKLKVKPLTDSWNLYDSQTDSLIEIDKNASISNKMSDWAILCRCILFVKDYLESKQLHIIEVQDVDMQRPHIHYKAENAKDCYIVVQPNDLKNNDLIPDISQIIKTGDNSTFYKAIVSIVQNAGAKELKYNDTLNISMVEMKNVEKSVSDFWLKYKKLEKENVYELIIETVKQKSVSDKGDIGVYDIPGYNNFLIKIHKDFVDDIGLLSENLAFIPYRYDEILFDNPHFGLPLFDISGKDLNSVNSKNVDSLETIQHTSSNALIIKRVSGESVMNKYLQQFLDLCELNIEMKNQMRILTEIAKMYSRQSVKIVLDSLKNQKYIIERGTFENESKEYSFVQNQDFYNKYISFINNYLDTLRLLSGLPQRAYDNAIKNIVMPKNFTFDFVNPRNILVDYETEEFNFIDFIFEKQKIEQTNKDMLFKHFYSSLLGINEKYLYMPPHLLFLSDDINVFLKNEQVISRKLNTAVEKYT